MSDGRVGQHSLHVVLSNGDNVANSHREDREHDQRGNPGRMNLRSNYSARGGGHKGKTKNKDSQERSKARGLGTGSHERSDWRRRSFINIRSPDMEWRGGNLES